MKWAFSLARNGTVDVQDGLIPLKWVLALDHETSSDVVVYAPGDQQPKPETMVRVLVRVPCSGSSTALINGFNKARCLIVWAIHVIRWRMDGYASLLDGG